MSLAWFTVSTWGTYSQLSRGSPGATLQELRQQKTWSGLFELLAGDTALTPAKAMADLDMQTPISSLLMLNEQNQHKLLLATAVEARHQPGCHGETKAQGCLRPMAAGSLMQGGAAKHACLAGCLWMLAHHQQGSPCRAWQHGRHVRQNGLRGYSRLQHPRVAVLLSVGNDLGHIGHKVTICRLQHLYFHRLGFLGGCTLGVDLDGKLLTSGDALAPTRHFNCHACGGWPHFRQSSVPSRQHSEASEARQQGQHLPQDSPLGSCAKDMLPLSPQQAELAAESLQG